MTVNFLRSLRRSSSRSPAMTPPYTTEVDAILPMMGVSHAGERLLAAVAGAVLLAGVIAGAGALFRVKAVPKGWRAPYTMRAASEIVWNQHEVRVEDVRSFTPFYDETPDLLETR